MVRDIAASPESIRLEVADVFRLHSKDVERWASRLGGPFIDLEDVVQEVFITVHRSLPGWREGGGRFTTWLYRITENEVRHRRRKDKLRRWLRGSADEAAGHLPSPQPGADEDLERQQSLVRFYRVLDGLRERYRTVLVLFELESLSAATIAEMMGTTPGAVWVALHRARAEFLQRMQQLGEGA